MAESGFKGSNNCLVFFILFKMIVLPKSNQCATPLRARPVYADVAVGNV